MPHNCVISSQATAWLKKIDSQTTICKILLSYKNVVHHVLAKAGPQLFTLHSSLFTLLALTIPTHPCKTTYANAA